MGNNTWNIRRLVNDSFVPSSQRPSVIYQRLTDFWSHRRPVAAAASMAWPHGRRPQAEAIESSGQGEEEWGEKEGRRKEEQTVAVLCLLSRGWPCYYYSTILG